MRWKDIPVLPGLGGTFGNEVLAEHVKSITETDDGSDVLVFGLMDVWVLEAPVMQQLNICNWVPVDHDPVPPMVVKYLMESGAVPIAMSRFGEENLKEKGLAPLYVPHGVDVDSYRPYPRKEARKVFAGAVPDDAFLIGIVAANQGRSPGRKGWQQALQAFRFFREKHENTYLYLHTSLMHQWTQGEDLFTLLASLEIPDESVIKANPYLMHFKPSGPKFMAPMYSALDVLLNPSMGEGFGIPMLESQAAGTPVIATAFSSMNEVVGAGWKVPYSDFWTGQKSWQAIADVPAIVSALEDCYSLSEVERKALSKKARRHALKYAAPRVMERHFLPALAEVEKRLFEPRVPSVPAKVVSG